MNARRVHKLMLDHFPSGGPKEWAYICGCEGRYETEAVSAFLEANVHGEPLLVEVHRTIGALLSRVEAASFISSHICKADIKVANREFTSVAVFARNGVARAWRSDAQLGVPADVPAAASRRQGRG